jgi:SAM-dependent methyltransferase
MNENIHNKLIYSHYSHADWGSIWKELVILNWKCQENNDLANFWSSKEKAKEFWKKIQAQIIFYDPILNQIQVHPGDRVLDIGGGPGTIAIPLAKKGASVTVVEPAEGMVAVLTENIQNGNVSGISIIHEKWEDLVKEDLKGPYDHVIACFSLGMPDIVGSIRKIASVSRGQVYLVWFSGLILLGPGDGRPLQRCLRIPVLFRAEK